MNASQHKFVIPADRQRTPYGARSVEQSEATSIHTSSVTPARVGPATPTRPLPQPQTQYYSRSRPGSASRLGTRPSPISTITPTLVTTAPHTTPAATARPFHSASPFRFVLPKKATSTPTRSGGPSVTTTTPRSRISNETSRPSLPSDLSRPPVGGRQRYQPGRIPPPQFPPLIPSPSFDIEEDDDDRSDGLLLFESTGRQVTVEPEPTMTTTWARAAATMVHQGAEPISPTWTPVDPMDELLRREVAKADAPGLDNADECPGPSRGIEDTRGGSSCEDDGWDDLPRIDWSDSPPLQYANDENGDEPPCLTTPAPVNETPGTPSLEQAEPALLPITIPTASTSGTPTAPHHHEWGIDVTPSMGTIASSVSNQHQPNYPFPASPSPIPQMDSMEASPLGHTDITNNGAMEHYTTPPPLLIARAESFEFDIIPPPTLNNPDQDSVTIGAWQGGIFHLPTNAHLHEASSQWSAGGFPVSGLAQFRSTATHPPEHLPSHTFQHSTVPMTTPASRTPTPHLNGHHATTETPTAPLSRKRPSRKLKTKPGGYLARFRQLVQVERSEHVLWHHAIHSQFSDARFSSAHRVLQSSIQTAATLKVVPLTLVDWGSSWVATHVHWPEPTEALRVCPELCRDGLRTAVPTCDPGMASPQLNPSVRIVFYANFIPSTTPRNLTQAKLDRAVKERLPVTLYSPWSVVECGGGTTGGTQPPDVFILVSKFTFDY
ncbi:hypothetical protein H4R33_002453 [Dimargaris cristalligena]|nr:hypothetical protein H4R33_002453 [Dimargaris cristalligena]